MGHYRILYSAFFKTHFISRRILKRNVFTFDPISLPNILAFELPIYDDESLFAKLLSVCVCLDAMPEESAEYAFAEKSGMFTDVHDIVMKRLARGEK